MSNTPVKPGVNPDNPPDVNQSNQDSTSVSGAGTPALNPTPPAANAKSKGGPATHKPGCGCRPCSARRRSEEARSRGLGGDVPSAPAQASTSELVPAKDLLSDLPAMPVSRMKQNTATWLKMKAANPDLTNKEIAKELGISVNTLQNTLYKAKKEGWLTFTDPLEDLRYGMIPKIADNLNLFLDARDRTVTLEAAKATLFRRYQTEEGIAEQPSTILALKIELPEGFSRDNLPKPKGVIVARPNTFVDAEVIEVKTDLPDA